MYPFCKLPHENDLRKVPEKGTSPYIDHSKTPETHGNDASQGDVNMTDYSYGNQQPAGVAILAQQLHHERQRAKYWEGRARTAESRPRTHTLPLTNAAGEIETPLPTTTAEQE